MRAFSSAGRHCRQCQWVDRAWRCCRNGRGGCPERRVCLLARTGEDRPGQVRWSWRDWRQTGMLHHSVLATGGRRGFRAGLILLLFLVASKANGAPLGAGGGGSQKTPLFETYSDWDREVKRTGASGWRVCSINEGYMISTW